jgi:ribosomal protein S18 acetylase RimI-like enzyme
MITNSHMYKIHRIGSESSSVLSKLWKDTFAQAYSDVHSADNIDAYCRNNFSTNTAISELGSDNVICKIAMAETAAVGFYLLKEHNCPVPLEGRSTELKQIYILSSHYGQGLGSMLYDDAINTMHQSGSQYVWLCVSDINHRAQSFYKKREFTLVGSGPTFEVGSDRLTSSMMVKRI